METKNAHTHNGNEQHAYTHNVNEARAYTQQRAFPHNVNEQHKHNANNEANNEATANPNHPRALLALALDAMVFVGEKTKQNPKPVPSLDGWNTD